jgi:hypothetical protein
MSTCRIHGNSDFIIVDKPLYYGALELPSHSRQRKANATLFLFRLIFWRYWDTTNTISANVAAKPTAYDPKASRRSSKAGFPIGTLPANADGCTGIVPATNHLRRLT